MRKKITVLLLCLSMYMPVFAWNTIKEFNDERTPEQKAWDNKVTTCEVWAIGITLILGQIIELFEPPRVHRVVM